MHADRTSAKRHLRVRAAADRRRQCVRSPRRRQAASIPLQCSHTSAGCIPLQAGCATELQRWASTSGCLRHLRSRMRDRCDEARTEHGTTGKRKHGHCTCAACPVSQTCLSRAETPCGNLCRRRAGQNTRGGAWSEIGAIASPRCLLPCVRSGGCGSIASSVFGGVGSGAELTSAGMPSRMWQPA